ncbi:MAG: hypothetical protein IKE43_07245 [Coriobacteriales bacterium]|nr:hypothetical protein [Coriobacteriales bacterium]
MGAQNTHTDEQGAMAAAPIPHGKTLADLELERVEQKLASGNVLDPIALDDPLGQNVERIILRVGLTVVVVIITGILLAQVACKNIQLASMVDLNNGVSQEEVSRLLANGTMWSGETLRFHGVEFESYDAANGVLTVRENATSSRVFEQTFATAMTRATALAMNAFQDDNVNKVVYVIETHATSDGAFTSDANEPVSDVCTITWFRDAHSTSQFSCTVEGTALPVLIENDTENQ